MNVLSLPSLLTLRFFRERWRQHHAALTTMALGGFLTLALCLVYEAHLPAVTAFDLKLYDAMLPLKRVESSGLPVIVDLDEASFATYGQWQWPRYRMADLVDALASYQVAAIGLDVLFVEPDRTSPDEIRAALQRDKGITPTFRDLPPEFRDNDRLFAEALARVPATLAAFAQD
ncbi:MAG: CHASE2 domain-containing protein, partial [Zoogloeaceae bacterium]|nr:CHASE2 domain-containing protein [Zoogloeaceae bacterium]